MSSLIIFDGVWEMTDPTKDAKGNTVPPEVWVTHWDMKNNYDKPYFSGVSATPWEDWYDAPVTKYASNTRYVPAASYSEITQPYAAALRMVRDTIGELFGPAANLESEEAVLLRGPEPHHDAEAIIAALQNIRVAALSEEGQ